MFRFILLHVLTAGILFAPVDANANPTMSDRQLLGQKLMLDFRFFCGDGTPSQRCNKPVTHLTPELADILVSGQIGGVILFAENIQSIEQVVRFNYQMQSLMHKHGLPPLFIAIDQEGGRVARLPDEIATRFVGNMAIGATYPEHGAYFAEQVGKGLALSVRTLGFNLNFAPTVDVNVNPDNPVINVRSYGESAPLVAELGKATVSAFQRNGVMSALKHFPGHGDTHVDSHTGLPKVLHDQATIEKVDLLPFAAIIDSADPPAMIMTAHIQYPHLDATVFTATNGKPTVLPATMSHRILSGLLREKMGYEGVIVTDALDMAGIAHYFDETGAVLQTFRAGADIALMPYTIRNKKDIQGFWEMYEQLLQYMQTDQLSKQLMLQSVQRILALKNKYEAAGFIKETEKQRIVDAKQTLPVAASKKVEQQLARAAITEIYNHDVLPLPASGRWQVVMPDLARCEAFNTAVARQAKDVDVQCLSLATIPPGAPYKAWRKDDVVIIGDISPQHSLAEMGGMDNLADLASRADKLTQYAWITQAMHYAKLNNLPVVFIALRAPYVAGQFSALAGAAITTYGYNVDVKPDDKASGAVFEAIAEVLLGEEKAPGRLPVTVKIPIKNGE